MDWEKLFVEFSSKDLEDFFSIWIEDEFLQPWKINMEHSNHPFLKENDLPNLYIMFHVNLPGCIENRDIPIFQPAMLVYQKGPP